MLIQKLASIAEENVEDAEPASCQVEDPDGIQDFSTAAEEFRILGTLVDEAGVTVRPRPKSFLKPMRSKRIPAGCRGLVSCRVPEDQNVWWMVSTAGSSSPGGEWISPRCVLTATAGVVRVPVINLGANALGWRRTRGLWKVTAVSETEDETLREEDNPEVIGAVEKSALSETLPSCSSWEDVNVNNQLSMEEKEDLFALLVKHLRCFSKTKGKTHLAEHSIETGQSSPLHSVPYRVSEKERSIIAEHVEKMLKDGVIQPSSSPWSSPVVLVRKPDKEVRFCIDYRRLNSITVRDVYPLPRVDDILGRLTGARYFTSLDLQKGFWQLPVTKEHREKTAFVTPDGLFEFLCMPFGLCGAPPSFQRLMDKVLSGLKWKECLCYMDDVLIFGRDFEEHQYRLDRVLDAIGNAGLTLNVKKCVFAAHRIAHLGHLIDKDGILPDPAKLEAVAEFPRPETLTQLRAFLGLASYYRRFIRGFAGIARPLHELLKKGSDVRNDWGPTQEAAFKDIKTKLTHSPVLVSDDGVSEVELQTDASTKGIGAVLLLRTPEGNRPVTFVSRKLSPAEEKYHANELECLALVWALNKLRHHIYGRPMVVKTDSNVLRWLIQKKDVSGKFARWILTLQEYMLDVQHIRGSANTVADALSRSPVGPAEETNSTENVLAALQPAGYSSREIALLQHADDSIRNIVLALQGYREENLPDKESFLFYKGVLFKKNAKRGRPHLLVTPSILRKDVLSECHDTPTGGYHGREKTMARVAERYWWKGLLSQ